MASNTITILTKRAFGFRRPDAEHLKEMADTPYPKMEDMYVTTSPNEVQECPSWITQDPLFELAKKTKDLIVVQGEGETKSDKKEETKSEKKKEEEPQSPFHKQR